VSPPDDLRVALRQTAPRASIPIDEIRVEPEAWVRPWHRRLGFSRRAGPG
jgi:hypothetical protein